MPPYPKFSATRMPPQAKLTRRQFLQHRNQNDATPCTVNCSPSAATGLYTREFSVNIHQTTGAYGNSAKGSEP